MIKVTMGQILTANQIFTKLINDTYTGRAAFTIARLVREVTKETESFEKARMEIIRRYGDKDENGELVLNEGNVHISEENIGKCNQELNDVLSAELEINAEPIDMQWLEKVELSLNEALALEPFMKTE